VLKNGAAAGRPSACEGQRRPHPLQRRLHRRRQLAGRRCRAGTDIKAAILLLRRRSLRQPRDHGDRARASPPCHGPPSSCCALPLHVEHGMNAPFDRRQRLAGRTGGPGGRDHCLGPVGEKGRRRRLEGPLPVLAIKKSVELAPFADVVYGCDGPWWRDVRGLPKFRRAQALPMTRRPATSSGCAGFRSQTSIRTGCCSAKSASVGAAGNSGFQALNLAACSSARTQNPAGRLRRPWPRRRALVRPQRLEFCQQSDRRQLPPLARGIRSRRGRSLPPETSTSSTPRRCQRPEGHFAEGERRRTHWTNGDCDAAPDLHRLGPARGAAFAVARNSIRRHLTQPIPVAASCCST
jgi:hypothetical protein